MSDRNERACSSCGSLLCSKDGECPTCKTCGRRGHLACTEGYKLVPPAPAPEPEVEVKLGIGADHKLGQVLVTFELTGPKGVKVALHYSQSEAASLAMSLIKAAQELEPKPSVIVSPNGKPLPPIKFPGPRGRSKR